ncbi:MAG: tetratricopeptide repeat protein [Deltaproteobacteria bacterium]|nr:tetratricopeptide repeat protein [Deltaproteobacteria bacterium]
MDKIEELKIQLANEPDSEIVHNLLGMELYNQQQVDQARQHFLRAVELKPDYVEAWYNLGILESENGPSEMAVTYFKQVLAINPRVYDAYNYLGVLYCRLEQWDQAEPAFARAFELNPKSIEPLFNVARMYENTGRLDEAIKIFEVYLETREANVLVLNTLASLYLKKDDKPRALKALTRSLAVFENQPEIKNAVVKLKMDLEPPVAARLRSALPAIALEPDWPEVKKLPGAEAGVPMAAKPLSTTGPGDDPFLKHIPQAERASKTGMNILIVGDFDVAKGLSSLMRAINQYAIHRARLITWHHDRLDDPADVLLDDCDGDFEEADRLVQLADFFHFGRQIFNFPGVDFNVLVQPYNALIQYFGPELVNEGPRIYEYHRKTGLRAVAPWDWSAYSRVPLAYYHVSPLMIMEEDYVASAPGEETWRIRHFPFNRQIDGTDRILSAVDRIKQDYPVELEILEGAAALTKIKNTPRAHLVIGSLVAGGLGHQVVSAMARGEVAMTNLSNWFLSLHPASPIINLDTQDLERQLRHLLSDRSAMARRSQLSQAWIRDHFDAQVVVAQYVYLYDAIYYGERSAGQLLLT